jgi:DNA-binding MarR family transcriptional regulator
MINKLNKNITHRMAIISTLAKRLIYKAINEASLEITPDQWSLLYYLWAKDGLSIGEIAELSKKDFSNVTRIVDKLVRDEYVQKKKDTRDKRSYHVFLLPKADTVKDKVEQIQSKTMSESLNGISDKEQKFLLNILNVMEINITKLLDELDNK